MNTIQEKRFLPRRAATALQRDRLTKVIRDRLLREPDIVFSYLHGSFIGGGAYRDIDVAVFVGTRKDSCYESDLSYELCSLLGEEVEVRVINDAPVAFQMAVLMDGAALTSQDDDRRVAFIEDVGRRYREYAHFRNVFREALRAGQ